VVKDDEALSGRQKKKLVSEGVRRLRAQPGWRPEARPKTSPEEALRQLDQEERASRTFAEAESCPECEAQRSRLEDQGALCAAHLAKAMGF